MSASRSIVTGVVAFGLLSTSGGLSTHAAPEPLAPESLVYEIVNIRPDTRQTASGTDARSAYGATGRIRCGGAHGTAQLVDSGAVIVTASHVLYGGNGQLRADACSFEVMTSAGLSRVAVDLSTVIVGSKDPLSSPAIHDWAVVALEQKVAGVQPYRIGGRTGSGADVTMVSGRRLGQRGWTVQTCKIHWRAAGRPAELRLDCSAEQGDSGAAVLTSSGRLAALYVGYRSAAPRRSQPFSDRHYNFAITVDGPIQAAVRRLARHR